VEDQYIDDVQKMALITTSSQLAKEASVSVEGVGEDLSFNFFGWVGGSLRIICQMSKQAMRESHPDRFSASMHLCMALRRYWGVTDITMVAEGFISLDPLTTRGKDLRRLFANTGDIGECITITHAYSDLRTDPPKQAVSLVAVPYSYEVGRKIEWKKMLAAPDDGVKILRESMYPQMLMKVLSEKVEKEVPSDALYSIIEQMMENGFEVFEFEI
jgi:hypothetical protein